MADTVASQNGGGGDLLNGLFGVANTVATGYFAEQVAKSALKAPPANTAIVVGGLVVVAVLIFVLVKK